MPTLTDNPARLPESGPPALDQINERVRTDAADGFIPVSHTTPSGLDGYAAWVRSIREGTGASEISVTTIARDHAARVRSYELIAQEWNRRG